MPAVNEVELLIVEDNAGDLALTMRALKKNNLANRVSVARDGEEALNFLFPDGQAGPSRNPGIIFLDLKLPKIDGLEVLRVLKGDSRTKCIPIVMLTSSSEEKDIVSSYQLGVNSYIVKPVEFENFVNAISELGLYWMVVNQPPLAGR